MYKYTLSLFTLLFFSAVTFAQASASNIWGTEPTLNVNLHAPYPDGSFYLADGFMQNFNNSYSAGVDNDDVRKIMNTTDNLGVVNGIYNLVVERRPVPQAADTFKIIISGTRVGTYKIELEPFYLLYPTLGAYLVDKYLNTTTSVSLTNITNIFFDISNDLNSRATDRFMLIFQLKALVPVRFTEISAVRNWDKTVTVGWKADNEINMQNYITEFSTDGHNFSSVGARIPTANNGGSAQYNLLHASATTGTNYYRVKGNSTNGTVQYSAVVKVAPLTETAGMNVYPNPVTGHMLNLHFTNQPKGKYLVIVTNKNGQIIYTETLRLLNSNFVRTLNIANCTAGSYQVSIKDEAGKMKTMPFIIQ